MPNVIAIIDDPKVSGQLKTLFRELDETNLNCQFFSSHKEFEAKYFPVAKAKVHPLAKHSEFKAYSPEQLDFLIQQTFTSDQPIPHPNLRIRIGVQSKKVEMLNPNVDADQKILGLAPEDFSNQMDILSTLIPAEFQKLWIDFYTKAQKGTARALLPMRVGAQIALMTVNGNKVGPQTEIMLQPAEKRLHTLFEEEKARVDKLAAEAKAGDLFSTIHLIVFKLEAIEGKTAEWLDKMQEKLHRSNFNPHGGLTRFIALKYEDDGLTKIDLLHPRLDDLVYLPLDRLIFLQKCEIILALPQKVSPNWLFTKEVHLTIEISKLTKLEKMSDVGLAIRNPVRLVPGVLAHFYFNVPGESAVIDIWGKVLYCEPHPEDKDQFYVYFSFFGLRKADQTAIRRFIAKAGKFLPVLNEDTRKFKFHMDDMTIDDKARRPRNVAVLHLEPEQMESVSQTIKTEIDNVKILNESSFAMFINRFIGSGKMASTSDLTIVEEGEMPSTMMSWNIHVASLELSGINTSLKESDILFGHPINTILRPGKFWQKLFASVPDTLLAEFVQLAGKGRPIVRVLGATTAAGKLRGVRVHLSPIQDNKSEVKLELVPATEDEIKKAKTKSEKVSHLDAVVVDVNLIPDSLPAFMSRLNTQLKTAGVKTPPDGAKIILLAPSEAEFAHREADLQQITGLFSLPLEHRHFLFVLAAALETPFCMYTPSNLGWIVKRAPIHVAKEVKLVNLSEFGASIIHPRRLAPGTVLYLRGHLFDNAPNRCLAARFYHCDAYEKEKGQFLCTLTYFGINDAFTKYARKWFRETYAQSKQGGE